MFLFTPWQQPSGKQKDIDFSFGKNLMGDSHLWPTLIEGWPFGGFHSEMFFEKKK